MADVAFIEDLHEVAQEIAAIAQPAYQSVSALRDASVSERWSPADDKMLNTVARLYGIPTRHRQARFVLGNLANELAADIAHVRPDGGKTLAAFSNRADLKRWVDGCVLPRGAHYEIAQALALDTLNEGETSGIAVERSQQLVRCNLALAYQALIAGALAKAVLEQPAASPFDLPAVKQAAHIAHAALEYMESGE